MQPRFRIRALISHWRLRHMEHFAFLGKGESCWGRVLDAYWHHFLAATVVAWLISLFKFLWVKFDLTVSHFRTGKCKQAYMLLCTAPTCCQGFRFFCLKFCVVRLEISVFFLQSTDGTFTNHACSFERFLRNWPFNTVAKFCPCLSPKSWTSRRVLVVFVTETARCSCICCPKVLTATRW